MSVTAEVCYEPPDTATPELDAEPTVPDDAWRLLEDVLVEDELVALEFDDALAVAPEEEDEEAETPGIVSALTVPKTPTPATAAKAMPAVI